VGILVEKPQAPTAGDTALVVGIGVNVGLGAIPPELADQATALAALGGALPRRALLLADIVQHIEGRIALLESNGFASLLPELRAHDALLGQTVRVDQQLGIARGIHDSGALLLEWENRLLQLNAGTVTFAT
jgi:biotin-(acetyl-CoA carboxylase) ligase